MSQLIVRTPALNCEAIQTGDKWFSINPWYMEITSYPDITSANYTCAGMRFQINIPQGAIIESAYLELNSGGAETFYNGKIYAHAADNSDDFVDIPSVLEINLRPRTTAKVNWYKYIPGGGVNSSPDIKSVIQEIILRPGWTANNWLTLLFIANTDEQDFGIWFGYAYDPTRCAKLTINYNPLSTPPKYHPNKKAYSGYHCFMEQAIKNLEAGYNQYKLPDGTLW
jgi:hypothetical protein